MYIYKILTKLTLHLVFGQHMSISSSLEFLSSKLRGREQGIPCMPVTMRLFTYALIEPMVSHITLFLEAQFASAQSNTRVRFSIWCARVIIRTPFIPLSQCEDPNIPAQTEYGKRCSFDRPYALPFCFSVRYQSIQLYAYSTKVGLARLSHQLAEFGCHLKNVIDTNFVYL